MNDLLPNLYKIDSVIALNKSDSLSVQKGIISSQVATTFLIERANSIAIASNIQLHTINNTLNQLLDGQAQVVDALDRTNQILSEINQQQRDHMGQVKRERALKEVLFQIEKYLEKARSIDDRITCGYTAEVLLSVVDQHRFGTHDLGDLDDKRFYDSLLETAKSTFRKMTPEQVSKLEEFRILYGAFTVRRSQGPALPEPKVPVPELKNKKPPAEPACPLQKPQPPVMDTPVKSLSDIPPMSREEAEEMALAEYLLKSGKSLMTIDSYWQWSVISFGVLTCGVFWLFILVPSVRSRFGKWVEKTVPELNAKDRQKYLNREEVKTRVESLLDTPLKAHQREQAVEQQKYAAALKKWEAQQLQLDEWRTACEGWEREESLRQEKHKAAVEAAIARNKKSELEKTRYQKEFNDAIAAMRKTINSFLDDHPTLQSFFPKV